MATVLMNDPNKKKNQTVAPNASISGTPSVGQIAPSAGPQFTNIQNLMNANKGAGQQLATKIGGNIQNQAQKTLQTQQQVGQAAEASKKSETENQTAASQIADAVKSADTSKINQLTPEQISQARKYMTGDNANITAAVNTLGTGLGQIQTKTGQLGQNVNALGNEAGRAGLLEQIAKRPSYGRGMSALDQTLLQTEGSKQLGDARLNALKSMQQAQIGQKNIESYGDMFKKLQEQAGTLGTDITKAGEESQKTLTKAQQDETNLANQKNTENYDKMVGNLKKAIETSKAGGDIVLDKDTAALLGQYGLDLTGSRAGNVTAPKMKGVTSKVGATMPTQSTSSGLDVYDFFNKYDPSQFFTKNDFNTSQAIDENEATSFNKLNQLLGVNADEVKAGSGLQGGLSSDLSKKLMDYQKQKEAQTAGIGFGDIAATSSEKAKQGGSALDSLAGVGNALGNALTGNLSTGNAKDLVNSNEFTRQYTNAANAANRGYTFGVKEGTTMADIIKAGGVNANLDQFLRGQGFGGADNTDLLNAAASKAKAQLQQRVQDYINQQQVGKKIRIGG